MVETGTGRVGAGGSIHVALGFPGAVGTVVGGTPSVGGTECADNPLASEGMVELEDLILLIGRVGRVGRVSRVGSGSGCGGGRAGLEELFDAAELCGGEGGELGVVGGELGKDFFLVGGSHHTIVKVAGKLVQHCFMSSK